MKQVSISCCEEGSFIKLLNVKSWSLTRRTLTRSAPPQSQLFSLLEQISTGGEEKREWMVSLLRFIGAAPTGLKGSSGLTEHMWLLCGGGGEGGGEACETVRIAPFTGLIQIISSWLNADPPSGHIYL